MALHSERDLPTKTREAVRWRVLHGYSLELAELKTGVSRQRIAHAIAKIERAHEVICAAYR